MKQCPKCSQRFDSYRYVCPDDGAVLTDQPAAQSAPERSAIRAPFWRSLGWAIAGRIATGQLSIVKLLMVFGLSAAAIWGGVYLATHPVGTKTVQKPSSSEAPGRYKYTKSDYTPLPHSEPLTTPAPPTPPKRVTVPTVVGQAESQAKRNLANASLEATVSRAASSEFGHGVVSAQAPYGGTSADEGDRVSITVSSGPPLSPDEEAIITLMDGWRDAWERKDVAGYMSYYANDASIFTNGEWLTYDRLYALESENFQHGGRIKVTFADINVEINGDEASVSCRQRFQRWGGRGNLNRRGIQTFRMGRTYTGDWRILEDRFVRN